MTVIRFRPRRADRSLAIALTIFESVRAGVDAPTAIIKAFPDLASGELFEAFSRAHHVLNNLQRELLAALKSGDDGGQSA